VLIVNALLELSLPYVQSLKGRRKIVASIKERLKNKNISLLDASGEYPKEAQIALCFLSPNEAEAQKKLQSIEKILERYFSDIEYRLSYEII
jgi:uncharacterized protein YlxP (DUF503 family)